MKRIIFIVCFIIILSGCGVRSYQITFLDFDDNEIDVINIDKKGEIVNPPDAPIIEGYEFVGWDHDLKNIQSDLVVSPIYEPLKFTVVFTDGFNELKKEVVNYGQSVIPPRKPSKYGHTFVGWSHDIDHITEDLIIYPLFEKNPTLYTVTFMDGNRIIKEEQVREGSSVNAPSDPQKDGYMFIGWSEALDNITSNLTIRAIYERIVYVSYIDELRLNDILSVEPLMADIDFNSDLYKTIDNVKNGGARGTNEIIYYDKSNIINRNIFGFEILVDKDNIVIDRRTLVDIPEEGGFVISAHGTSIKDLQDNIQIGDYIFYDENTLNINIYRNREISPVIALYHELFNYITRINKAMVSYLALDYHQIQSKLNEVIDLYNLLVNQYNQSQYNLANSLLLDIDYLLIENKPVQVKAFWHYPLKSGNYSESNAEEVRRLLDDIQAMGFNRIYLNTNFGGWSVYKSEYLIQMLANKNTYEGYKDYLECFITEAHKRGISVYAWTNTLIGGDGYKNPFYADQGWFNLGYNGEDNFGGMYYLDISNPKVEEFLLDVFYELANNYNLDGIEFDFIRYPAGNLKLNQSNPSYINDSGYTPSFMNRFKAEYNIEGDLKYLIKNDMNIRNNWLEFKKQVLDDLVRSLTMTIKSAKPDIRISAAVMPSIIGAKKTYLQDWELWVNEGLIDELEPMIYTGDSNYLITSIESMYQVIGSKALINVGIFPEGSGLDHNANAWQIIDINNSSIAGWSKFSSKTIFSSQSFKNSLILMYRPYNVSTNSSRDNIIKSYLFDLQDKTVNYYIYLDTSFTLLVDYFNNTNIEKVTDLSEVEAIISRLEHDLQAKLFGDLNYIKTLI